MKTEAKRQCIPDLLDAHHSLKEVCCYIGCSQILMMIVRKLKKDDQGFGRKSGSGGHNRVVNNEMLMGLLCEMESDLTVRIKKEARRGAGPSEGL